MQQYCKCRLRGDRDETIKHIISELAQKESKRRYDWVRKVTHNELWHMHNPESVLENERLKILRDFKIQRDHLFSARRSDLVIISKKRKKKERTCRIVVFVVPGRPQSKNKRNRKERYVTGPC